MTDLPDGRSECDDFFVQQFFQLFARDVVLVQVELEELGVERWCAGLIIRVMVGLSANTSQRGRRMSLKVFAYLEVWVCERLLDCDTLLGVERKRAREEVDGERVGVGEERGERTEKGGVSLDAH